MVLAQKPLILGVEQTWLKPDTRVMWYSALNNANRVVLSKPVCSGTTPACFLVIPQKLVIPKSNCGHCGRLLWEVAASGEKIYVQTVHVGQCAKAVRSLTKGQPSFANKLNKVSPDTVRNLDCWLWRWSSNSGEQTTYTLYEHSLVSAWFGSTLLALEDLSASIAMLQLFPIVCQECPGLDQCMSSGTCDRPCSIWERSVSGCLIHE